MKKIKEILQYKKTTIAYWLIKFQKKHKTRTKREFLEWLLK